MSQTEHILNSLIAFLTEPDKTWSLVTVPFMFAFVAFFLVYIHILLVVNVGIIFGMKKKKNLKLRRYPR